MYRALVYFEPLNAAPTPASVDFTTFIWLFIMKAPKAAPRMVMVSNGKAFRITSMLPP